MGAWDILVIAFGVMVFFVGLTYAELTSAMPQCGGEHVFSYRAMGTTGSFGCVIAYMFVSISFCILRKKKPEMERPYKVKAGRFVGVMAVVKAGFMTLLYIIPASFSAALVWQEWIVVGIWLALGVFFYFYSKRKYGAEFGRDIFIVDETKDVDGAPAVLPNAKYPDRHFVITVGCKYGSGGPESARMVADYCILQARNVATDIPVISCLTAVCWAGMQRLSLSRNW